MHDMVDVKGVVGRAVRIICPASGYPLDKIVWAKGKNQNLCIHTSKKK